ncbi:glycosyl hydrolase family 18 protein [Fictibacillus halophilus]|uniref:glycosyl hydrolase family 18 protein n=1 Tax=Fictibacillus halophilus TaxID=1610490 RepID=UPI003640BAFA
MKKLVALFAAFTIILSGCGGGSNEMKESEAAPKNMSNETRESPRLEQINSPKKTQQDTSKAETKHGKTKIETLGFLEPLEAKQSVKDVKEAENDLTYIAFFSYQVNKNGTLKPIKDWAALKEIKKTRAMPMMVLTNFAEGNFSPEIAHNIFTDKKASKTLIGSVISTMKQKGYKALNIDFEHIKEKDRELYNGFLETIIPQVQKEGFKVSTALAPKTSDEQKGPWHGAHDYKRHGELADFVVLMTYEWGWSGGPPMAVAPVPQVKKVVDYAVSVIPPEKIIMGAPLYGYDWTLPYKKGNKFAKRIAPAEAHDLALKEGASVKYDNEAQAPFFNYKDDKGKEHVVWFENEQSAEAKNKLVKQYKLRGLAYWVLGEPFPENWTLLRDEFQIAKK